MGYPNGGSGGKDVVFLRKNRGVKIKIFSSRKKGEKGGKELGAKKGANSYLGENKGAKTFLEQNRRVITSFADKVFPKPDLGTRQFFTVP